MNRDPVPHPPGTDTVVTDPWSRLRAHTPARIALGRSGTAVPTIATLEFGLAHALARDAVHAPLDTSRLRRELESLGFPVMEVRSRAGSRAAYLARPDWGRRLDEASRLALARTPATSSEPTAPGPDLAIVVADGLSSLATQRQAPPLLASLNPHLARYSMAPVFIASQARVALGDEIGGLLRARILIVLIGERPGLSAADSLGAYLTFEPRVGRNDAERNCISNIRPAGLAFDDAAGQIATLVDAMSAAGVSGVQLRLTGTGTLPAPP